jgi:hypothetical protein
LAAVAVVAPEALEQMDQQEMVVLQPYHQLAVQVFITPVVVAADLILLHLKD